MISLFDRYLIRETVAPFLLGMTVFTGALLMGRLLKLAELVITRGVPLRDVALLVVCLLPTFLLVTIPMALLLAVLLAMGRLSADSELIALQSCGVSLQRFIPPVMVCAVICALLTLFVTVSALPWGNTTLNSMIAAIARSQGASVVRERVFEDKFPGVVFYVDRFDQKSRTMHGVIIHDERDPKSPATVFAQEGTMIPLSGQRYRLELRSGSIHQSGSDGGYRLAQFANYQLNLDLRPPQTVKERNERDMSLTELRQGPPANGTIRQQREYRIELQRRFAMPAACLVFALLAIPLGIQNQRAGKGGGFAQAIAILLCYYVVLSSAERLALAGRLHVDSAMWIPNLLFLALAVWLFRRAAQGRELPLAGWGGRLSEAGRRLLAWRRS